MAASPLIACLSAVNSTRSGGGNCKYTGQSVVRITLRHQYVIMYLRFSRVLKFERIYRRALPIRILTVGKKRSRGVQLLVDDYSEKLNYYCSVEHVQLRSNPRNARDVKIQIQDEDKAAMNLLSTNDWVVMLDEGGSDISSEQMAELIGDAGMMGASRLSFCIGGPYGHGKGMRERANKSVKLSSLVLNHEIALLVLIEQLYRSWTILKGQKYHH
ncbi:hypothetical protein V2J09_011547 [Rumex salicifolius]